MARKVRYAALGGAPLMGSPEDHGIAGPGTALLLFFGSWLVFGWGTALLAWALDKIWQALKRSAAWCLGRK